MERLELEGYLKKGESLRSIGVIMNKSLTTVRYWVKKYELIPKDLYDKWNKSDLIFNVLNSESKTDVLKKMGLTLSAGNFRTLKKYLVKYDINYSGLKYDFTKPNFKNIKYSYEDIFCINSNYTQKHLKNKIIKEGLIEYKCLKCFNIGEWLGEIIILQLDHINGINNDNRLENLRFLCPNCHSQTPTFSIGEIIK